MSEEEFSFTPEGWVDLWAKGYIGFHFKIVHPLIKEFLPWLCDGKTNHRILVPLCGKSLDMPWLVEQGHQVVGVDCVEQAAKEFFEENKLEFTVADIAGVDGGKLYRSSDGKIEFYVSDFFNITSDIIGQFEAIWDIGGLFAVPGFDVKNKYAEHLKSLTKNGGRILLDLAETKVKPGEKLPDWDESLFEADVKRMFAWCSSIKLAKTYDYKDMEQYLTKDPMSGDGDDHSFEADGKLYQLIAK